MYIDHVDGRGGKRAKLAGAPRAPPPAQSFRGALTTEMAHVVAAIPEGMLHEPRSEHTQDETVWRTAGSDAAVSLAYLIRDYCGHMRAHLAQLFAVCGQ